MIGIHELLFMSRGLSLHCIKEFVSEYNRFTSMPAEVFVSSATSESRTTTTWEESSHHGLTNSINFKSGEFVLSDEMTMSNGHFETSELSHSASSHKCSKCSCLLAECLCVIDSHQVGPAYFPNANDCDLVRAHQTYSCLMIDRPSHALHFADL